MKRCLCLTLLCTGALVLWACSRNSDSTPPTAPAGNSTSSDASPSADSSSAPTGAAAPATQASDDMEEFAQTARDKLSKLRTQTQELLKNHPVSDNVKQDLQAAVRDAGQALKDLRRAGAESWKDKKPKVESILAKLQAKFEAAKAKLKAATSQPATQP